MIAIKRKKFSGIGSRETPNHILKRMSYLSGIILGHGLILRSGGAKGADLAFETAYSEDLCEIFLAKHADDVSMKMAAMFHPKWSACSEHAKRLHGRNAKIILGENLDDPVDFVICYTIDGKATGGTATGIKIAKSNQIPVFNLYHRNDYLEVIKMISCWDVID